MTNDIDLFAGGGMLPRGVHKEACNSAGTLFSQLTDHEQMAILDLIKCLLSAKQSTSSRLESVDS